MSTRRYDLSQRARPLGLTTRGLRREGTRSGFENRGVQWETSRADRSVLSVVVAAKNEAPNLPQLIQEIARALRLSAEALRQDWRDLKSWSSMTDRLTKHSKSCWN